jgi:hypothetical protein
MRLRISYIRWAGGRWGMGMGIKRCGGILSSKRYEEELQHLQAGATTSVEKQHQ